MAGTYCCSNKGFTLLELLISFSIIALIVLIIAGAMRLAYHSVESGEKRADFLERFRGSISLINAQVQSQVPLTYTDNAEKKFYFVGERELLTLSTNYSIWGSEKGYSIVTYKVETDNIGKKKITATEQTIGIESLRQTLLLTGFDEISFEYFYKGPTDEKGSWTDRWTEKTSVPDKILLHLVLDKKNFSMIIPMRTAAVSPSPAAAPAGTVVTPPQGQGIK
ncbi:MAG: prepilin-type N-terminal cleavage/methylation domain-containing protein [Thermodesulfovibrionales bacterium]